ncbi:hypothetical protein A4A49_22969 [Nicotiana attenuata]|uniref:Uncharacterized protein n=1 Tax=Nicotiana attenuata TaxID=49451 RepID=A0A314KPG4_NICAT|nr:hypothetical protein A4A49_22969 [Nicotiana attenuata]
MPRFKSLQKKQNSDQESSKQAPTIQTASRKRSGSHWTVEAIDSEKNVKKLKVKVKEVLNLMCEERIMVDFDYLDEPFGDARGLLSGFCGVLACDCTLYPIHCEKWSSLPMSYFNSVFDQIIKPKFFFKTTEPVARQHVYKSIGKKWAANKLNLWSASEDPLKSRAEIIDNVPDGIPLDQWISFVDYQYKDSTKEKIELALSQSTIDESEISPNDAIGKVLGKEHFGRNHNQMMNALKAYMIMKEGTIPEQFAGFFASPSTVSPTTPSDAGSGPLSPLDPRRSRGDSNSSEDR